MDFQRSRRVGEEIHREISALLQKGLKDPRIGFVTITAVEVTPDLHLARVFFTVIGDEKARKDSEAGLARAVPYLRRELGKRLRMRYIPDILFRYDGSIEYGNRIETILKEINSSPDNGDADDHGDSQAD
ncbi:MAG: ribosome-binding factor A [Desulfuromonas sp.]|nr:MAG: ribosome-binding factor A [Desulfuromonas sp.]